MKKQYLFLLTLISLFLVSTLSVNGQTAEKAPQGKNLAIVASPTGSARSGAPMTSLNDGLTPTGMRQGGNRPPQRLTSQWVQYDWNQPVTTKEIAVFWWNYGNIVKLPQVYRVKYWDGSNFVSVKNPGGLGLENKMFNITRFDPVTTTKLRLELDSVERFASTLIEWMVLQAENSPNHPPVVDAGVDRSVMTSGKTYLSGGIKSVSPVNKTLWSKVSGPGNVNFTDAGSLKTTAAFTANGEYTLSLTVFEGDLTSSSSLKVKVMQPPPAERLNRRYTWQT